MAGSIWFLLFIMFSEEEARMISKNGSCFHSPVLATIYCLNINAFPEFALHIKQNTVLLDITNSTIIDLKLNPLEWSSLVYLDLRGNEKLACNKVHNLINNLDLDYVISDCEQYIPNMLHDYTTITTEILSANDITTISTISDVLDDHTTITTDILGGNDITVISTVVIIPIIIIVLVIVIIAILRYKKYVLSDLCNIRTHK